MRIYGLAGALHYWMVVGGLLVGVLLFPSAGRDDAHISYWSAYALREFGALLNYSGEPLEQSSSLLHVLLLAAASEMTRLDPAVLGVPLSVLFGGLAMFEAGRLARAVGAGEGGAAIALAATSLPLLYWSFGGMEASLLAYLLTAWARVLTLWQDSGRMLGARGVQSLLLATLFLLSRPEAFLVFCAFLLFVAIGLRGDGATLRRLLWLWLAGATIFALLTTLRYASFDSLFPQPVAAKVDGNVLQRLRDGLHYYQRSYTQMPTLALLSVLTAGLAMSIVLGRRASTILAFPVGMALAYLAFTMSAGGDWMEGGRFFAPVVPLLAVLAVVALRRIMPRCNGWVVLLLVAANLVQLAAFTRANSTSVPLAQHAVYDDWVTANGLEAGSVAAADKYNRVHLRDALFLPHLREFVRRQLELKPSLIIASPQAGLLTYYLFKEHRGRLRFLDLAGLASREFTACDEVLGKGEFERGSRGIGMTLVFYVEHLEEFRDRCGVPLPDMVFALDDATFSDAQMLEASGRFRVEYRQSISTCPPSLTCPLSINNNIYLAVRTDPGARVSGSPN